MFDFIKRLFGEGKIRIEVEFDDGSVGTAKVPYIGDINTLNIAELEAHAEKVCLVEYGKHITKLKVIGIY